MKFVRTTSLVISRHILTIPGSGRRVHYRRCGSGPALLMVHQSPRNSSEYDPLMREWGQHFTCIAPDTPGFGQSDPLPGSPEIDEFAEAIAEFVRAVGVEGCPAYGFHSGGIILVSALRRHPHLFSGLAIGGYAVWTAEEMRVFGESYLPALQPQPYGEHLTWLWNRMLEQSWFFPWFDVSDEARLSVAHADVLRVNQAVMEMLDAGDAYRAGYGAVLRAPRDIPAPDAEIAPVLITAYDGDPLQAHIARLGAMPPHWNARAVASPVEHHERSFAFLHQHAEPGPAPVILEDPYEGWLELPEGKIHWRGAKGAARLVLHAPASEMADPGKGAVAIDVPGHGLSSNFQDIRAAIQQAADALGATEIAWPAPAVGEPELLYPDLTPDRYGSHLLRAWTVARAEALFCPWYRADPDSAVSVVPADLEPEAIASRARAKLRAGDAARRWHDILTEGN